MSLVMCGAIRCNWCCSAAQAMRTGASTWKYISSSLDVYPSPDTPADVGCCGAFWPWEAYVINAAWLHDELVRDSPITFTSAQRCHRLVNNHKQIYVTAGGEAHYVMTPWF